MNGQKLKVIHIHSMLRINLVSRQILKQILKKRNIFFTSSIKPIKLKIEFIHISLNRSQSIENPFKVFHERRKRTNKVEQHFFRQYAFPKLQALMSDQIVT